LKPSLMEMLACPRCRRSDFDLRDELNLHGEVKQGEVVCRQCGVRYPIVNYVPRFVPSDAYVRSFSYQWEKLPRALYRVGTDDSFLRFNINTDQLSHKRILDVGCGYGRFVDLFSEYGREVVGVDLSYSVDEAFRNCGLRRSVHIAQADLFNMPFKEGIFNLVFSFGVLHHTADTRRAFMELPKYVKPGGKLAVFIYAKWFEEGLGGWSNRVKEKLRNSYRHVTSRLPHVVLYALSHVTIPLYHLMKLPKVGTLVAVTMPTSFDPNWRLRIIDTFDRYSPRYEWRHTRQEVVQWFKDAGFVVDFVSPHPVTVVGTKLLDA
jgi:SAM-dependent methyltransferase